jgi:hypothetical protein
VPGPASYPKPGPSALVAIIIMVIGALIAVPSAVKAFAPIVRAFTENSGVTPLDTEMHFSHDTYLVYESDHDESRLAPTDVSVVDSTTREPVMTHLPTTDEHVTSNGTTFNGVVAFDIPQSGQYELKISAPNHVVIIALSLEDAVKKAVGWFALLVLGGIVFVVGLVLLIVGATRRGRAKRMAYAYAASGYTSYPQYTPTPTPPPIPSQSIPAGWYPDPTPPAGSPPGQKRWWDGSAWTEHTQP